MSGSISLLDEALKEAGLPNCKNLLGKKFVFYSEHGSHEDVVAGTVTGIALSDGQLFLYSQGTKFWGEEIQEIYRGESWHVKIGTKKATRSFGGTFSIL